MRFIGLLILLVLFSSVGFTQDWDPFTSLNQTQSQVDDEEVDDSGFIDTRWQVNMTTVDKAYIVTLMLAQEDLPTDVIVDVNQGQLRFTLGSKIYFVPIESDGLIDQRVVKIDGDKIRVTIPRKKLHSVI